MKETIEAIYENGVLRPLSKLQILEGQRIWLTVEKTEEKSPDIDENGTKKRYDFTDLAGCLSSNDRFAADPVDVQREFRDEWS